MHVLWQDFRYAARTLIKRPGFAIVAVLTIAIGVGANTSVFSIVNAVLLEPLPVADPDALVRPRVISPEGYEISLAIPNFRDWRARNRSFTAFGANVRRSRTLTGGERPEVVVTRLVLGDFFETLGVAPALGRVIPSDETWEGAAPVAVVSHGFWERRLGADPGALGQAIILNGQPFTVIGVMPPEFVFPSADTEVFLPMGFYAQQMCWETRDCSQGSWAIARLRPGVSMDMAQADLDRIAREIANEEGQEVAVARLEPLSQTFVGDIETQIWVLMGAVAFVLLIACANVASLLLARGENRRRELAVRTAIGAGRGRLVRQLLAESMVLALAGGAIGTVVALVGIPLLVPAVATDLPSIMVDRIGLDLTVFGFTIGVTTLAGLVFGLAPALRGAPTDLHAELKEGGRGTAGLAKQRLRLTIVAAEVALSLVLLIGAGLMLRSLGNLRQVDKGFVPENLFTAEISLPRIRYPDKDATWRFFDRLLARIEALPGARQAALSNIVPLEGSSWEQAIWPEGTPIEQETAQSVLFYMATPDFIDALGIPLLRGRRFTDADRDGTPAVAIIDETMAERFWPGEDPIGKRVTFESAPGEPPDSPNRLYRTVIGVTRNVRHYELETPSRIQVYVPVQQSGQQWTRSMKLLIKTAGDPLAMTEPVRRELAALDRDVPVAEVQTMDAYVDEALSSTRVVGGLLALFSVIASTLAAIGIFGVMSYLVVQRVREIGIRMALGARPGAVLRMIVGRALMVTGVGIGVGLFWAFALTRVMGSLLYGVEPVEPLTYLGVTVLLASVATGAALLPAGRATRIDPAIVLREE